MQLSSRIRLLQVHSVQQTVGRIVVRQSPRILLLGLHVSLYGNRYRELGLGKGLGLVILHYYALETGFGKLGLGIRLRIAMQPIRSQTPNSHVLIK
jgi:hypothetical protein